MENAIEAAMTGVCVACAVVRKVRRQDVQDSGAGRWSRSESGSWNALEQEQCKSKRRVHTRQAPGTQEAAGVGAPGVRLARDPDVTASQSLPGSEKTGSKDE